MLGLAFHVRIDCRAAREASRTGWFGFCGVWGLRFRVWALGFGVYVLGVLVFEPPAQNFCAAAHTRLHISSELPTALKITKCAFRSGIRYELVLPSLGVVKFHTTDPCNARISLEVHKGSVRTGTKQQVRVVPQTQSPVCP